MGIFQTKSVPRVALYLPKVHALISKQFQYQILNVLGLQIKFCVFHDLITDIIKAWGIQVSEWTKQVFLEHSAFVKDHN